jgi:hypothetical protein
MATTAAITLTSDIMSSYGSYTKTMTLTKAGALTDIEETIGFSRRKFAATTATDLIRMADELVDTTATTTSAKVYIQNIGDGKGTIDKATYVTVSVGVHDGTMQEIGRLYGGDWTLFPVTTVDGQDVVVAPSTNDAVVLEYTMFYE